MDQSQENPFSSIIQDFVSKHAQSAGGAGEAGGMPAQSALADAQSAQAQGPQGAPMPGGPTPDVMKSDLEEGTIQGTTPSIVQAINALNNVIKTSKDKDTIMVMRSVVSLLSRFVAKDQEAQSGALEEMGGEQPSPEGAPASPQGY